MENYRKIIGTLVVLFISFLSVQNTYAITLTTEVKPTGNAWENPPVSCMYQSGTWTNSVSTPLWGCDHKPNNWDGLIWGVRTIDNYPVVEGNYYQLQLILRNNTTSATIINPIFWNFSQSSDFDSVTLEEFYIGDKENFQRCAYSYTNSQITSSNCSQYTRRYNAIYTLTLRAKTTGNVRFQVGSGSGVLISGDDNSLPNTSYLFGLKKVVEFESNSDVEQAEEKTEEQSEEGQNNADSADSDNEQASENVISVIGDVIGAFSTPAGDCTLPADLGNVDLGNMNLCTGKPPEIAQIINIVGSIIIVYACYKVARNIFRIFIAITAFAQGNGKGNTD